jgi:hypothetical protein
MARKKRNGKKSSTKLSVLFVMVPVLVFLLFFGREILFFGRETMAFLLLFAGGKQLVPGESLRMFFSFLSFNCLVSFGLVFILWLFIFSLQSILPVTNFREVFETLGLVVQHAFGTPVRIARVIGGELVSPEEKLIRRNSNVSRGSGREEDLSDLRGTLGVIVQDSDSAAVLETIAHPRSFSFLRSEESDSSTVPVVPLRVCGPGLVFMKPWERAHSFVDLRKQIRSENEVIATTGDGIEVKTFVFSVFSLGRIPKPVQLAFTSGSSAGNLQVVALEPVADGRLRVTGFEDSLAADDRLEAYDLSRNTSLFGAYFTPADPGLRPVFDEKRVFGAVYARARGDESDSVMKWDELPIIFTTDAFKEMALQFNYDELSNPNEGSQVGAFKQRVNASMRNQCVLSYSIVVHESGRPLQRGEMYSPTELRSTAVRNFTTSKVLRDRGITNIFSAFTQIIPCKDVIYTQRLDNWQARLQREIDLVMTSREIEVRNIVHRARIQAQEEISTTLNAILGDRTYSEEAMALLLFQALEEYVSDPETRKQLPNEVITLLRNLQDRILPPGAAGMPFLRD